jgi:hypothetical protein
MLGQDRRAPGVLAIDVALADGPINERPTSGQRDVKRRAHRRPASVIRLALRRPSHAALTEH